MALGEKKLTPMMAQYQAMRRSLPEDILLLYRLGDFYEMFFDDAKIAAGILNVALTKRHDVPMCGVPHHAAQGYIAKLIRANKRVAIAEQTSEPVAGKLVDREIAQIISAGTVDDLTLLDDTRHNYLAAVYHGGTAKKPCYGLACADHTTGAFTIAEFPNLQLLEDELTRLSPSELLISDEQVQELSGLENCQPYDGYAFIQEQALHTLKDHFKVQSLDGFGCSDMPGAIAAAGGVLHYLTYQLRRNCAHLRNLSVRNASDHVLIDTASQANLDLVESRSGKQHTLVGVLDRTSTPMGARKLRDWILHPLRDLATLTGRLNLVDSLLAEPYLLTKLRDTLKNIRDIERTTGRLSQGSGNGRDLKSLQISLEHIPNLKADLSAVAATSGRVAAPNLRSQLLSSIQEFPELVQFLQNALVEEPPALLKDGGLIRDGHSEALDELRSASRDGKQWIAELQQSERKRTGIDTLKIKFNNVFGYFIEITKSKAAQAPDDYQRKQTMANAERFITPGLKEVEGKVLGADDRAKALEYDEFIKLRSHVTDHLVPLQTTADALATLDVLISFAETAQLYQHTRPVLDESCHLQIINGRHPVLEQTLVNEKFVPNDTLIDPADSRLQILTGPNMAGKSTYIRQIALVTLMAQIGAYVPAEHAHIGLTDRIFCRVGASDDLAKGQSTFMVEMNETALIVNNATEKSLVILDEIGRGTATFDGLSIAWSVAEHLHDEVRCRTLFATHYHELCALSDSKDAVANFNVAVREWNEDIIFLRKILPGPADKSYGIQVARLAGLPKPILDRAKEILSHLEMTSSEPTSEKKGTPQARKTLPEADSPQMDLFA
jgi:DNA mismatch repair protein MutS|tara:strand:+ start:1187 stop:3697 length:2511 start_codon:yes stop_codon:yes gene_type:complete